MNSYIKFYMITSQKAQLTGISAILEIFQLQSALRKSNNVLTFTANITINFAQYSQHNT